MHSVIIPAINESLLGWTVDNVKRVSPDAEIIVMEDKKHEGVGQMRHRGIKKAKHDTVIIIDGHMDFAKNCFKLLESHVAKNPKAIACPECRGLDKNLKPEVKNRFCADLYEVQPGGTGVRPNVFVSKWRKSDTKKTHDVPIVLGACYAMSKEWYMEGLGGVWKYQKGWGKSEQMLCLMNHYMGGSNACVASTYAAHLFRKGRTNENFGYFKRNIMLLLHGFVPETRREQLIDTFCPANRTPEYGIKGLLQDGSIDKIRGFIADNAVKSYDDIRNIMSEAPGTTNYGALEQPRCCPKCKGLASRVIKTYSHLRRKRRCLSCGAQYPTFTATA